MKAFTHSAIWLPFDRRPIHRGRRCERTKRGSHWQKPKGFLHQVRQAQLQHVADGGRNSVAKIRHAGDRQTFGIEDGVLNDIWQSHFSAFTGDAGHVN